jgi:gliding motility-associated-like protein
MHRRVWLVLICIFSISPVFGQSLPNYVPTSGLMGWWPLDGNANDISGNGYNGTAYGVTSVSDRNGNSNSAYSFDITSTGWGSAKDRIVVTDDAVANAWYQANAFTISTWIKLDVKTGSFANRPHTILGVWDGNGTAVMRHQISASNFQSTKLNSTINSSTALVNNNWVHVVTSWDGDTLRHYQNGTAAGKSYLSYSIPSSTNYADITFGELHMGNGHWYHFAGSMDDMGVWDRALSPREVEQLYTSIVPCTEINIAQSDTTICFGDPITLSLDVFDQADYTYLGSSNTSKYYIDNNNVGWTNSRNAALAAGADFVVIEDSNEQNLLYSFISDPAISSLNIDGYHIGYYQDLQSTNFSEPSGGWTWVNGTSTYTNWANNEPSNSGCGTEDWVHMYPNGQWNDQCDGTYPNDDFRGIIEVPIFPSVANLSWSTGSTQSFITVSPTQASTYWIETIENGSVCRDSIQIGINHPQINVTNPTTCGNPNDSSLLTLSGFSGTQTTPIDSAGPLAISMNWSKQMTTIPGEQYTLELEGLFTYGTYCPSLVNDPAFGLPGFYGNTAPTQRTISSTVTGGIYVLGTTLGRPNPDVYNPTTHKYSYPFTATGNSITVGWQDSPLGDNCGSVSFRLIKVNRSTLWSTSQSEDEIWVKPNVSANYWVAQTLGNTTCTANASVNILPKTIVGRDTTVCEGTELTLSGSGGFSLNGANNYIALEKPGPTGQTQRSFSVWFKTTATTDMTIFGYGASSCRQSVQLRLNHNANYSAAYNGTTCPYTKGVAAVHGCHNGNFDAIVSDGQWHHVAYVMGKNNNFAYNNIDLYLDGQLISNSTQGCFHNWGGWPYNTGGDIPITIGKLFSGNSGYFDGEIDDFAIFDTAITSTKVQDIYSSGIDLNDSHLSNYFNFENIIGDSIFDLKGDNHGKIYGALNPSASAAPNSGMSYLWSTGDTTSSITFTANNSASYWLRTTSNGTSCYDTILVTVLPSKVIASDSLYCLSGDSALLYVNSTGLASAQINPLSNTLSNGLIAWYPFNGNANDESGNLNHGTVYGASLTTDRHGNANSAYSYDGDDWTQIAHNSNLDFSLSDSYSISCWIEIDSSFTTGSILEKWNNGNDPYPYQLRAANGQKLSTGRYIGGWPQDQSRTQATPYDSSIVAQEMFLHLLSVYTPDTIYLYVNGVLRSSQENLMIASGNTGNTYPLTIGRRGNSASRFFKGKIDDLGIWNRVLTQSEINSLYNQPIIQWSTTETNDSIYVPLDSSKQYYVVTSQNGTTCSDSITIVVNQGIQASDTTICYGESVTLSSVSGQSAIWSTGDTASSITVNPSSTTKYWATTSYSGGTCSDTLEIHLINPNIAPSNLSFCDVADSTLLFTSEIINNPTIDIPHELVFQSTKSFDQNWQIDIPVDTNTLYLLEVSGLYSYNGCSNNKDAAFYTDVSCVNVNNHYTPYTPYCAGGFASWWLEDSCNQRPINDTYNTSNTYMYKVRAKDGSLTLKFFDNAFSDNSGQLTFKLFSIQTPTFWSTGQTTDSIWVKPTQTTTYWIEQSLNGVTCSDSATVFINKVNIEPSLPTICAPGDSLLLYAPGVEQGFDEPNCNSGYVGQRPTYTPGEAISGYSYKGIYNGHHYYLANSPGSWTDAAAAAKIAGGHLICIDDTNEQNFVANLSTGNLWLGYYRTPANTWAWVNCQTSSYTNWRSGEPGTSEPYAHIITDNCSYNGGANQWNDIGNLSNNGVCYSNCYGVLEIDPDEIGFGQSSQVLSWSNGANNDSIWLTPTLDSDYWLTSYVNGEGCSDTVSLRILEPNITASTTTSCSPGDSVMLYYSGFNSIRGDESILWSTGETSDTIWVTPTTTSTYSVIASRGGVNCLDSIQIDVTNLSNFDPLIPTRIHCQATNTVLDGTEASAITYSWSTGTQASSTTVSTSGQYWVQATDNLGCSFSDTTQVWFSNIQSNLSSVEPTCYGLNNGSISPNPTGGVSNYSYLWNNGDTTAALTATASGLYWVTITDSVGCSVQDSILLDQPLDLAVTAAAISDYNGFNIPCFGGLNGQALATVSGGILPYTYSWSNGSPDSIVYSLAAGIHTVNIMDSNGCITSDTVLITQPTGMNTSLSITSSYNGFDVSCFGVQDGGLQLTASGGVTPYQHYWNNGLNGTSVSNIGAGLYTVNTVDANGCSSVDSITLIQPNVLTSTATVVSNYNGFSVSCFGASDGSSQVSALGGNAPYVYSWSNGTTSNQNNGMSAGNYSVTVTDTNGCSVTNSIALYEPTELQISTSITSNFNGYSISCSGANDGSAMVSGSGGTAPYTILWSNGDTSTTSNNLSAGTYFVTITDANGCSKSDSVVLTDPVGLSNLTLSASLYNGFNISCDGGNDGNITMTGVNGGTTPLSYSWNTGDSTSSIAGIPAGNYTLTVTDVNGCSISDSLTLNQPTVLTSNASATSNFNGTNISCNGVMDGSAQVSGAGGVSPYTFLWNTYDTTTTISNLSGGSYSVLVTDANGCSTPDTVSLSEPSSFTVTAGILSNYNGYNISCAGGADGQIAALVNGGVGPYNYNWSNGNTNNAQNNLTAGTYLISVTDANNCLTGDTLTLIEPAAVSANAVVTSNYNGYNVSCQGAQDGSAVVNTQGGVAPYVINWSNGGTGTSIGNLGAGSFSITVQDANGCSTNASVVLTGPNDVTAAATSTSASCYGISDGSASLALSGGTGNYIIQWSNGQTGPNLYGLASNWYSYTITTSPNCFLQDSIWVDQPTPLVIQVDTIPPTCISAFDGEINVVAFGGTPGYQYFLNGTAFSGFQDDLGTDSLTIVAVDMNNCDTTVILAMPAQTQSCLFIPNWFTPNGNSQEDTWRIEGFEHENLRLKVFNVMGQLIYTTESSIYIPWDGSYNGSPLPEGDYYYLIESTVNDSRYSGYVTLLR